MKLKLKFEVLITVSLGLKWFLTSHHKKYRLFVTFFLICIRVYCTIWVRQSLHITQLTVTRCWYTV
jgi:hypothetical protein